MQIQESIEITAPIAAVWKVVADDYHKVGYWARAVQSSAENTDAKPVNGSAVGGRVCETDIGPATEVLTHFDASAFHLTYKAHADKMPFFVRGLFGDWRLRSHGAQTVVEFGFAADLSFPFSLFMPALMKGQFQKAINETLEDLKIYVETGVPHPDKSAA